MISPSKRKRLFLTLTVLSSIFILAPNLFYQNQFAQGDHGRDLYAISMSADGKLPFRDYQWFYGPLMPFYYALFFKFFGESIASVLLGETILKFVSGILFFFIMYIFTAPFWSFLSTIFLLSTFPFFVHTYNHVGAVACLLFILFMLLHYITSDQFKYLMWGLLGVGLLFLTKLNFGVVILYTYVVLVAIINLILKPPNPRKLLFYSSAIVILPAVIFLIYAYLTSGLPDYVLDQSFPLDKKHRQQSISILLTLPVLYFWIKITMANNIHHVIVFILFLSSLLAFPWALKKIKQPQRKKILVSVMCISVCLAVSIHEFIPSGILYRLLWGIPFLYCFIFLSLGIALFHTSKIVKIALSTLVFLTAFSQNSDNLLNIQQNLTAEHFFSHDRAGVFLGNPPEWINTVDTTVKLLDNNLNEGERFFAFPYDPLYYYLTDRQSPVYTLIFFNYLNMPLAQERQTIEEIENGSINWVIYSSRILGFGKNLGRFGTTHGLALAEHLNNNFEMKYEVGNWSWDKDDPPDWFDKHGIRFLRRIEK